MGATSAPQKPSQVGAKASRSHAVAIAFFDLDKTLLAFNSASRWVRSEVRGGHLGLRQAFEAFVWIARYHLGFADVDAGVRLAIGTLAGQPEKILEARTLAFYEHEIRGRFRPGALTVLAEHRHAGDSLVLLSSTSPYLSRPVCAELGLDDFLCTRFGVDGNGNFTGRAVEPLCFGPGKVVHAEKYAAQRGLALERCAYYADSMADVPMLQKVGRAVAVNPDQRLRRVAHARGWPVVDWGSAP